MKGETDDREIRKEAVINSSGISDKSHGILIMSRDFPCNI